MREARSPAGAVSRVVHSSRTRRQSGLLSFQAGRRIKVEVPCRHTRKSPYNHAFCPTRRGQGVQSEWRRIGFLGDAECRCEPGNGGQRTSRLQRVRPEQESVAGFLDCRNACRPLPLLCSTCSSILKGQLSLRSTGNVVVRKRSLDD